MDDNNVFIIINSKSNLSYISNKLILILLEESQLDTSLEQLIFFKWIFEENIFNL